MKSYVLTIISSCLCQRLLTEMKNGTNICKYLWISSAFMVLLILLKDSLIVIVRSNEVVINDWLSCLTSIWPLFCHHVRCSVNGWILFLLCIYTTYYTVNSRCAEFWNNWHIQGVCHRSYILWRCSIRCIQDAEVYVCRF